jgi:methionyl-tRNA formyltransferase
LENDQISAPAGTIVDLSPEGLVVATGEHQLLVKTVQPDGGAEMPAREFARENNLQIGDTMRSG